MLLNTTPSSTSRDIAFDNANHTDHNYDNDTDIDEEYPEMDEEAKQFRYVYVGSMLLVACAAALLVNALVLATVCWIRRPLTRTLRLSVSLAAADAFSSLWCGLGLLFNSVLPYGLGVSVNGCVGLVVEALRLGAISTAELHLLALAVHHLLGILRPLQYPGDGLRRAGALAIAALWLLPPAFFAAYFASLPTQGFRATREACPARFMLYFKYRALVGGIVLAPLVGMLAIYLRIFALVRSLDASRPRHHAALAPPAPALAAAAAAAPSPALRRHPASLRSRCSLRSNGFAAGRPCGDGNNRQQRVARHVKAARTTLLIVGSCVMGWAPAVSVYVLLCEDCPLGPGAPLSAAMFHVYSTCNLLLILKTLLNPIIYAARMNEIKVAARLMRQSCCGCWRGGGVARRRSFPAAAAGSSTGAAGGGGGGAGLARAGTVVGYLRRSPLGDSGGAVRGGGGGGGDADGAAHPLTSLRRSVGPRAHRVVVATENL